VAIDHDAPVETERASAIENEIPAYRAISATAVASLLLGLLAALSFAEQNFLVAAVAAIVVGLYADRKIRRFPDLLTGRGLAQAGIALGLVFGLASITSTAVNRMVLYREAAKFGRKYAEALGSGQLDQAAYYKVPETERAKMTPQQVLEQMKGSNPDRSMFDQQTGAIRAIQERLKGADAHVAFVEVEAADYDRLTPVAAVIYEVHGHGQDGKETEALALVEIKAEAGGRGYRWYVSEVQFPYARKSYVVKSTSAGDGGHGHAH
jgi:hypothetical protein